MVLGPVNFLNVLEVDGMFSYEIDLCNMHTDDYSIFTTSACTLARMSSAKVVATCHLV